MGIVKKKWRKTYKRGMMFQTEELAEWRVTELKGYGRPAIRLGKTVYEVLGWEKNNKKYGGIIEWQKDIR